MPSYYVPQLTKETRHVSIEGDEYHHLSRVARHRIGDEITLNSGKGLLAKARITTLETRSALLEIISVQEYPQSRPGFSLAYSILQNKHDEWIVEKATELGCSAFYPFIARRTVRKPATNTLSRFEKVALAAVKQCDNPHLPKVTEVKDLLQTLTQIVEDGWRPVVLSERRPDKWLDEVISSAEEGVCFITGPEGGFSDEEFELFENRQIHRVCISPLILRAETAAIAAASQFNLLRRIR